MEQVRLAQVLENWKQVNSLRQMLQKEEQQGWDPRAELLRLMSSRALRAVKVEQKAHLGLKENREQMRILREKCQRGKGAGIGVIFLKKGNEMIYKFFSWIRFQVTLSYFEAKFSKEEIKNILIIKIWNSLAREDGDLQVCCN